MVKVYTFTRQTYSCQNLEEKNSSCSSVVELLSFMVCPPNKELERFYQKTKNWDGERVKKSWVGSDTYPPPQKKKAGLLHPEKQRLRSHSETDRSVTKSWRIQSNPIIPKGMHAGRMNEALGRRDHDEHDEMQAGLLSKHGMERGSGHWPPRARRSPCRRCRRRPPLPCPARRSYVSKPPSHPSCSIASDTNKLAESKAKSICNHKDIGIHGCRTTTTSLQSWTDSGPIWCGGWWE